MDTPNEILRVWSSYGLVQLARLHHWVSWSLACLTSTWDAIRKDAGRDRGASLSAERR